MLLSMNFHGCWLDTTDRDAALEGVMVVNEDTTPTDAKIASVAAAYGRRRLIIFIVQVVTSYDRR